MAGNDEPLLQVENLEKHFPITAGVLKREVGAVRAVDGISFTVDRGETFGLVGESGCGKSTAAKTIMHLLKPTGGRVRFDGVDVSDMDKEQRRSFRRRAQMIFQDPDSSFDPRMSIGESVAEPLRVNGMTDRERRREIVAHLLDRVGLEPKDAERYPHEFSGGQKQRIGLARALSVNPDLLVADEPVSALDVSIQAEILSLMDELQDEFDLGILIISHNLGVIREICDDVGVMYVGELAERGPTKEIFDDPQHPYTRALLSSIPQPDPTYEREGIELTGDVPSPSDPPPGCRFHTRCPEVIQPESLSLEQSEWRRVMDFAQRVYSRRIDPDAIRESVVTMDDSIEDPAEVELDRFGTRLREEFGIPSQLSDPSVETILEEAIGQVDQGALDEAADNLEEALPTSCRTEVPEEIAVTDEHVATCHLIERGSQERSTSTPPATD